MDTSEKYLNVLKLKELTEHAAEIILGFGRNTLTNAIKGNRELSPRYQKEFMAKFHINDEWWTTQNGPVFKEKLTGEVNEPIIIYSETDNKHNVSSVILDQVPVRVVEVRAQAGYLRGYNDPEYMEHLPVIYVSKEFERGGNYQAFVISGDSMVDGTARSLPQGTTIVGKELQKHYWTSKLHYKQYLFVIVHKDGVLFKQVTHHDVENGTITIHSFNSLYEDEVLNLSDCYQLFYMKKIVDKPITF